MGIKPPPGHCKVCCKPTGSAAKRRCPEHERPHKFAAKEVRDAAGKLLYRSKKEERRHSELLLMERLGAIVGLRREVRYKLLVRGRPVATYVADFVYVDRPKNGVKKKVVEDAKGVRTPYYKLKARLFEAVAGYKISEV